MKIAIAQPVHETGTDQLAAVMQNHPVSDAVLFPEGYLANEDCIEMARDLAKTHSKMLITGYRNKEGRDRAIIINRSGEIILERAKTPSNETLYSPSVVEVDGLTIGCLLCVELLQGLEGLKGGDGRIDFIAQPIGVGMFSDGQFDEWMQEARKIAIANKTIIMGASHADGSYRNCGVSIPISYCIDENGETLFVSKSDLRTRVVNIRIKEVEYERRP